MLAESKLLYPPTESQFSEKWHGAEYSPLKTKLLWVVSNPLLIRKPLEGPVGLGLNMERWLICEHVLAMSTWRLTCQVIVHCLGCMWTCSERIFLLIYVNASI